MVGSSMTGLLLLASLLCEAQPNLNKQPISACWDAVQEEEPQPAPASEDFVRMARFVVEFAKLIKINEVYFCLMGETGLPNGVIKRIFASILSQHMMFFMPCDLSRMMGSINALDAGATPEDSVPQFLFHPAVLHLTTRKSLATTLITLWKQNLSDHFGALHIIMGVDLPPCQVQLEVTARWFQSSYNLNTKEVMTDEVFLFNDGRESLHVPVTKWHPHSTKTHSITILHEPDVGPEDFQGHAIQVIAMDYSPQITKSKPCKMVLSPKDDLHENVCHKNRIEGVMLGRSNKETAYYEGYLVDVIYTIVNLSVLPPESAEFGIDNGDGNYSGLVGALQSRKTDIALVGLSMTRERYQIMDFSEPIAYTGMGLFVWTNSSLHTIGWNTFVLSFHWGTWLAIILLLAVMTAGFWFIVQQQRNEDPHFNNGHNVIFIFFSCLVQQGSWILPTTGRAQGVLWMFWFSSVVLYASYTARLTSFLTVSSIRLPFSSLEQAVNTPGWKIGILKGTSTIQTLERSQKDYYKKLYKGLKQNPSPLFSSEIEGINRVLTEPKYAVFTDQLSMEFLLRGNCSIKQVPGSYLAGYLHLGLRKRLPYATVLNKELIKMSSGGLLDRMHQHWWGKSIPCEAPSPYTELGFSNILTAFMLLLAGAVISLLILMVELYFKRRSTKVLWSRKVRHGTDASVSQQLRYRKSDIRHSYGRTILDIKKSKQMTDLDISRR
ncbi:Glutamate receptor ionotropic, kainate 4-like 1 [Homarus americanus]|uniref:Glutamate receptor ionotropic, kainate 4-like 1 n=1 Tax=Homarus americanus TaxID=6706 RepID=A0A8J5K153_HOMAM|nr:Glutamate receptor ionotropic, kainate 4-like 1 [Homarus americanus]